MGKRVVHWFEEHFGTYFGKETTECGLLIYGKDGGYGPDMIAGTKSQKCHVTCKNCLRVLKARKVKR